MKTTDNIKQSAYKRVVQLRSFYTHLAIYILLNLMLLIPYFILDIAPIFWQRCFIIMVGVAGLGVLGHAVWVFGPRLFFSAKWEARKIEEIKEDDTQDSR